MMSGQPENVRTYQHLSSPFLKCVCLYGVVRTYLNANQLLYTRDTFKTNIGRLSEDLVNRACSMTTGCHDTCPLMSETELHELARQLHVFMQNNFNGGERQKFSYWYHVLLDETFLIPREVEFCTAMITAFYSDEVVTQTDPVVSLFANARVDFEENVQRTVLQTINKIKKAAEIFKDWLRQWLSEWKIVSLEMQYRVIDDFEHTVDTLVQQVKEAGKRCNRMIREIVSSVSNNTIGKEAASSEIKDKIEACKEEIDGLAKLATERMEEYTRRHISTHHVVSQIMIAVKA
ncbi:uncharacterized protein LOC128246674 isoform X2 [Mya arenaria]|nr:uncharacterized protein LOC128246674 isoform X2 [Mya arenaria]XP_052820955.1 uncharacterized protein LOC128246674 isoform X2 [Mya arenaria]XP_052820956.1 uncharacterized protein LOC128246674 isoform X2 [Mya arenaria]